jgi:hypothetical protein
LKDRSAVVRQDPQVAGGSDPARPSRPAVEPAPSGVTRRAAKAGPWAWWVGVALAAFAVWAALTWPSLLHLRDHQHWVGGLPGETTPRDGALHAGDHLQNVYIDSVFIDNLLELREPYLDLREGAAGPAPLRTNSLNLPWTGVVALLRPLVGLVPAYNLTLLLSTVATALAAHGLLRRHTRWPLLAAAGALLYAAAPHRMWQLAGHFNAVMWWAFPAAVWAFEAAVERWHAGRTGAGAAPGEGVREGVREGAGGRSWRWPAVALVAVPLTVAFSGELHLVLYMTATLLFLAAAAAVIARSRRASVPWPPLAVAAVAALAPCAYALWMFTHVFGGRVDGGNGSWQQVELFTIGPLALVRTEFGLYGEGLVYVGWVVATLAAAGAVLAVAKWRRMVTALPYALLLPPVVFFTFGPRIAVGGFEPYRTLFSLLPLLSFQRVPQRLMVVTDMVLVLLAVVAVDRLGGQPGRRLASRLLAVAAPADGGSVLAPSGAGARRAGAALIVAVTLLILVDYRFADAVIYPGETDNAVIERLAVDGDAAGPVLGLPILGKTWHYNSASTYVAALSRRRVLNAYNQTPAPWLDQRTAALEPLNRGVVSPQALALLRATGTRQVIVTNVAGVYDPGQWSRVIDGLVASGQFRLIVRDEPMALLATVPEAPPPPAPDQASGP